MCLGTLALCLESYGKELEIWRKQNKAQLKSFFLSSSDFRYARRHSVKYVTI